MRIKFCILLVTISSWAGAQIQFPKTPTKFLTEFKTHVLKTATDSQKVHLQNFENVWLTEALTPFQKKTTMQSIQILSDKKQASSIMLQTANLISIAKNRNGSEKQLDTLVQIFKYSFENTSPKEYQFLLKTLESYLKNNILYQDNIVTVKSLSNSWDLSLIETKVGSYGGGYEFEDKKNNGFENFDSWDTKPTEEVEFDWSKVDEEPAAPTTNIEQELVVFAEEMPTLSGGILKLNNTDLQILTALDTVLIKGTSGNLSLSNGEFVGQQGTFDWTSVGLDQSVYAKFKKYHFSIKTPELLAEDVEMMYPEKVDGAVSGIFEYKYQRRKLGTISSYPRFMSYQNKVEIKGLGENIEYKGGFAMNGPKVFSSCVQGTPSTIKVKEGEDIKFKAIAPYFELNDSLIDSKPTKIVMYIADGDSITHPGVKLKYNNSSKKMMVRKDITTMKDLPFTNTYHQLEMDVDMIEWTLKDTVMTMEMVGAKQQVPAYFNSMLSYNEADYIRLKGAFPFHPLQVITNYCNKNKTKEFSASALADATKQKQNTIESSISFLQKKGFVVFSQNSSTYSLTEKAKLYQFARQEKKDYDVIFIKSTAVTKPADPSKEPIKALPYNGSLNLNDNKLTVAGVDKVVLSDSNNVFFEPKERKIVFTKNRNIVFDGTLKTNNYIFNGREFEFNYEKFNLKLEHIDSIEFTIEVYDSVTKTMKREKMDNKLSYSKGTLSIDEPTNKSGIKRNPRYPHFDANHGASVLFSNADILNGVYDSTFRYIIPPFAVDSLSGDMESNVSFDGEFVSGGVFPPIPQKLEVMNDRGFGFNHKVPEEGYPIYGGLGRFYGKIAMSKSGLRGEGKIVFLNTTLESLDFVFYRDSVKGLGDIAITKPGTNPKTGSDIKFPACTVTDYEMSWYPSLDSMHITNYDNAFKLFNDEVDLSGALIITSKGMKGTGLVETNGSLTISKNFLFKETSLGATKAQFEILTTIVGKPALKSDYVNIDIDLAKKQAFFSPSEEGYASNNFPYLKYKTSLNDGFWDMEKKIVTMEKPYEMDLKDSYFYSTKKSQDSLVFNAEKAYYYIDSLTLKIEGVEQIKIADAMVYPENKKIEIKENAKITTLKNAVIIMDTLNEYHTLIHGEIDINSRNDLDGHASYRYVNFEEDTIPIKFSDFKLEAIKTESGLVEYHTIARGVVEESDTFMVAPQMIFKGDVVMYAHRRLLSIDGYIKLDLHGKIKSNNWMRYKNASDSDVILIDLESQENKNNLKLITGVFYDANAQDYYALFIGDKKSEGDLALFSASGYLTHDAEKREFEVIDKVRLDSKSYIGNLFGYIEKEEVYKQEGKFTIINQAPTLPHHYQLLFGGAGQNVIADSSLILKGLANLNFETIPQVYEQIGIKFKEMLKYLPPAKTIRLSDTLYHAIGDLAGQKEALKYKETCSKEYVALNKVVKLFDLGLTFNDLSLEWDASRKTWHSKGPIGLVSVGGQDINTFVKGYLEIIKTSEEDHVNFYLEANPDLWYYFTYSENSLRIYTSDAQLTTLIQSKNTESKNMSKGLYYWASAEEQDATRFKQHFVQDFLNGKDLEIDYTSIASSESEDEFEVKDEKKDVKDEFEEELDANESKKESTKPKNKEEIEKTKETVNDSGQLEETTKEVDEFEETVKNVQKEKPVEENTTRPESKESEIKTKKEEIYSKKSKDKKSKEKSNKEPEKEQDIEKNTGDVDEFEQ